MTRQLRNVHKRFEYLVQLKRRTPWTPGYQQVSDDGVVVSWFGIDQNGYLGWFSTGIGALPDAYTDECLDPSGYVHRRNVHLRDFFPTLPFISKASLTDACVTKQTEGFADYEASMKEAQRGLYSFHDYAFNDDEPWELAGFYELIASPTSPLQASSLPSNVLRMLRPFRSATLAFASGLPSWTWPNLINMREHLAWEFPDVDETDLRKCEQEVHAKRIERLAWLRQYLPKDNKPRPNHVTDEYSRNRMTSALVAQNIIVTKQPHRQTSQEEALTDSRKPQVSADYVGSLGIIDVC